LLTWQTAAGIKFTQRSICSFHSARTTRCTAQDEIWRGRVAPSLVRRWDEGPRNFLNFCEFWEHNQLLRMYLTFMFLLWSFRSSLSTDTGIAGFLPRWLKCLGPNISGSLRSETPRKLVSCKMVRTSSITMVHGSDCARCQRRTVRCFCLASA